MTAVNLISAAIFSRDYPFRTKLQLFILAAFFLIFLYPSPAGLVIYWTLNNLFSLVKNIFYKLENPKRILCIISACAGVALIVYGALFYDASQTRRRLLIIMIGLALLLPLVIMLSGRKKLIRLDSIFAAGNKTGIVAEGVFLSLLLGCVIPSAVIASSPQEFMNVGDSFNPVHYIVFSCPIAVGLFIIWAGVFYYVASDEGKNVLAQSMWILCGICTLDYMLFGTNLGLISANLRFDREPDYTLKEMFINVIIIAALGGVFFAVRKKSVIFNKVIVRAGILGLLVMSVINLQAINTSYAAAEDRLMTQGEGEIPKFTLSRNGRNVIVIMLDRAINTYIPYFINEKPELKEKLKGFTYYGNTVSFGAFTNVGASALFGGYEYTPIEMNRRDKEPLVQKHNEALKVMPVIFENAGYDVTVCDPTYAGYQWIPDLSIYGDYPGIHTYITEGKFADTAMFKEQVKENERNFFCYSLMKTAPVCLQKSIYNAGCYNAAKVGSATAQERVGTTVAHGMSKSFLDAYNVLCNMQEMTEISDEDKETFLMYTNNTTHEPMLLQEPSYTPAADVDNSEYEREHRDRYTVNGVTIDMTKDNQVIHYQTDMAVLMKLGEWFDYMRENGVYDNTRIVIASDHGRPLYHLENMELDKDLLKHYDEMVKDNEETRKLLDLEFYYPLLMVKDFDSDGFVISDEFMTNADVPTLALQGIIDGPVNPFTHKPINNREKYLHDQYILATYKLDVAENSNNTFLPDLWLSVHDNMRDKDNWSVVAENSVLKDYK